MDIIDIINQRYSVRAYKPDPVEDTKLSVILDAARLAPTASNRQPFKIVIIHVAGKEEELLSIYPKKWFVQAPLVLCLCGTPADAWVRSDGKPYLLVDIGIVMDHIVLAAANLGLGTCIVASFNELNARRVLLLSEEMEPILFTPIGYPADSLQPKQRKALSDLVRYEKWDRDQFGLQEEQEPPAQPAQPPPLPPAMM